jgi:hemerythrin-like domain-containing protein
MLTTLGSRSPEQRTTRELLLDCHGRIRRFCAIARRLADGAPVEQAREAALALDRYFRIALPLHVADEDESLRPRLDRLHDPALSAALETMSAEHVIADEKLAELLERWRAIAAEPSAARCVETRSAALWLDGYLTRHLGEEETRIFPALERLPPAESSWRC